MKKKNGFTLVELIAVIAILAVILVMFVPSLLNSINSNKDKALNKIYDLIETATRNYVMDYNISTPTKIELEDLCETTYIECPIINPNTEKELNGYIFIGKDYYYSEEESTKLNVNYDGGETTQTFNQSYAPGFIIELDEVSKMSYSFLGWEVVEGNSVIVGNKLTIGTTETIIKPKFTRFLNNYIKYLYDDETTRIANGLTNPIARYNNEDYDTGIRYSGSDPSNYVYFNCKDKDSNSVNYGKDNYDYASSCEVWRIIGVFDVASEINGEELPRIKIVRNESLLTASWDSSASNINEGKGINQWGPSGKYKGSDLMKLLNEYYIGKGNSTCKYCNDLNQEICTNDCSDNITTISGVSYNMIDDVIWSLGAIEYADVLSVNNSYIFERNNNDGKICDFSSVNCNDTVTRTTEWKGKIGLIYPSDFGYASTDVNCGINIYNYTDLYCKQNNWLHRGVSYWSMTPFARDTHSYNSWLISGTGYTGGYNIAGSAAVFPSLYLKSSVYIIDGTGSSASPYKLAI